MRGNATIVLEWRRWGPQRCSLKAASLIHSFRRFLLPIKKNICRGRKWMNERHKYIDSYSCGMGTTRKMCESYLALFFVGATVIGWTLTDGASTNENRYRRFDACRYYRKYMRKPLLVMRTVTLGGLIIILIPLQLILLQQQQQPPTTTIIIITYK